MSIQSKLGVIQSSENALLYQGHNLAYILSLTTIATDRGGQAKKVSNYNFCNGELHTDH